MGVAFVRAPDVVVTRRAGAAFLTRLDTGDVFEANEVALLVFERAAGGATTPQVVAEVAARHPDVPADEVHRDVADVLDAFLDCGLLRVSPES